MARNKEVDYFDLFILSADAACRAADLLKELVEDYTDLDKKIDAIKDIENKADGHHHELLRALNRAFITPIEREDIYDMANQLDDLTDSIEDIAIRFKMYNITVIRPEAIKMVDLISRECYKIKEAMKEFKNFRKSKIINNYIVEINHLEEEGDEIYQESMHRLFTGSSEAIDIIKWRLMFEIMEDCSDVCEDVANVMEAVITKNS